MTDEPCQRCGSTDDVAETVLRPETGHPNPEPADRAVLCGQCRHAHEMDRHGVV